jgi:ABC-2 type transport system permease protein
LLCGIPVIIVYLRFLTDASAYHNIALVIASVIMGHVLCVLIFSLIGFSAFILIEVWPFRRLIEDTIRLFAGAFFPIAILPLPIARIALVLPFRFMYSFPLEMLFDKADRAKIPMNFVVFSVWIILLAALNIIMYRTALKKTSVQGGDFMDFLSLYFGYVRVFFKARMEYRFSFFAGIFANFYCYLITYTTFWVITRHFESIDGWKFEEMTLLYGLNLLSYSVAGVLFWYTVYQLDDEITSGNLDSYLIRPVEIIKQMACRRFGDTFLGQIIVTAVFMASAISKISYQMTFLSYIYLAAAIVGGVLIQSGAMILLGSLSFWTLRAQSLANILYYDLRSFIHYPISIFPQYIRLMLTYVLPWAIINYYPSLIILHKVQTSSELATGLLSPLIGACFFALSIFVFNMGLRRYSGSGS